MKKEKLQNLGLILSILGNVIMISTAPFAGIEISHVYLMKGIGGAILLAGVIFLFAFWIAKRKEARLPKKPNLICSDFFKADDRPFGLLDTASKE